VAVADHATQDVDVVHLANQSKGSSFAPRSSIICAQTMIQEKTYIFVLHGGPDALPNTWWVLLLSPMYRLRGDQCGRSRGRRYLPVRGADLVSRC
jgi:hypothetical protein